jgi:hypothetical protein
MTNSAPCNYMKQQRLPPGRPRLQSLLLPQVGLLQGPRRQAPAEGRWHSRLYRGLRAGASYPQRLRSENRPCPRSRPGGYSRNRYRRSRRRQLPQGRAQPQRYPRISECAAHGLRPPPRHSPQPQRKTRQEHFPSGFSRPACARRPARDGRNLDRSGRRLGRHLGSERSGGAPLAESGAQFFPLGAGPRLSPAHALRRTAQDQKRKPLQLFHHGTVRQADEHST